MVKNLVSRSVKRAREQEIRKVEMRLESWTEATSSYSF